MDEYSGELSGTPQEAGSWPLELTAVDRFGASASFSFDLVIASPLQVVYDQAEASADTQRVVALDLHALDQWNVPPLSFSPGAVDMNCSLCPIVPC